MKSFSPSPDVASYKDLLLFEERLKQNAALLRSRKNKYQIFLAILVLSILVLVHKSFLHPSPVPSLHYLHLSLLPVAVVTLLLFFASGMYSERIGYANRYVPHANKALRSLNMHLNMRVSSTPLIPFPLSLLVPSSLVPPSTPPTAPTGPSKPTQRRPLNPKPIPAIPPTKNPRGELIFSSRVDRGFREGYERYRALFEKKREERYRQLRARKKGWLGIWSNPAQPSHLTQSIPPPSKPTTPNTCSPTPTPPLLSSTSTTDKRRSLRSPSPSGLSSVDFPPIPEMVALESTAARPGRLGQLVTERMEDGGRGRAESFSFLLDKGREVGST